MKVHLITDIADPIKTSSDKRRHYYAKGLLKAGMECEIVSVRPNPDNCREKGNRVYDEVNYRYLTKRKSNRNFSVLIRNYFLNYFALVRYFNRNVNPDDAVLGYSSLRLTNYFILLLTKLKKIPAVYELCEHPQVMGRKGRVGKKMQSFYTHKILPKYDGMISISRALSQLYETDCGRLKIIQVPILIDRSKYTEVEPVNCPHPYTIHTGTYTENKDGFCEMVKVVGILKNKYGINVTLYGTGNVKKSPDYQKIISAIEKYHVSEQIVFLGYLEEERLEAYQQGADFFIVNKPDTFQNQYCFATKMGEYLMTGNPVITTNVGEAKYHLKDGEEAYITAPGDVEKMTFHIYEILKDDRLREKIGRAGKNVAENEFDYVIQGKRLRDFFESL